MNVDAATSLRGRDRERDALHDLLVDLRGGRSRVLVVRGEPGIGKSALLEDMCDRAERITLVRGAGVESEAQFAFAGLHRICSQLLEGTLARLPAPQLEAIRVAFGEIAGEAPDPFLLGLAVLNRLADQAAEQPVICVVDDAQWLDRGSAQTLAFVARRLQTEAIAIVFAVREPIDQLAGLPELVLTGIAPKDARELLDSVLSAPLDEAVGDRFIAETRGNPLALLELPHGLNAAQLAGGFGLANAGSIPGRVEESFRNRIEELPARTRLAVLVAAAEPGGDPVLLWRAASRLGIAPDAAAPAEAAGLLSIGTRVEFRHPLVRSATYRSATAEDRRRAHRALADATDPELDPDRRAWHRGQGILGPDERVADDLERSANRAKGRGGLAASAAFLSRAVELTPDPERRGQRALLAAEAEVSTGAPHKALELLNVAEAGPLGELALAQVDLLRAQIAFAVNRGSDAPALLLKAARRLEPLDPRLARNTYLEAFGAALFAGRFATGVGIMEVAAAVQAVEKSGETTRADDLLVDGLSLVVTEGYAAGAPTLKRALSTIRAEIENGDRKVHWLFSIAAYSLWDYESWRDLTGHEISRAREAGELGALPLALTLRAGAHQHAGELSAAASLVDKIAALAESTRIELPAYAAVALAAWYGREDEAGRLMQTNTTAATDRGEGLGVEFIEWVTAILHNGLGNYEKAFAAAAAARERPAPITDSLFLQELVEAAVRSGHADRAASVLDELSPMARASGTDWALGIEARCRAQLCKRNAAEGLYRDAIDHLQRSHGRVELARAHLLYGEWLRREGRRVDARQQLRIAYGMLDSMGVDAFAARAARELAATGERVRKRAAWASDELTAQEGQIARLAAKGYSNRQIGSQLFISHRTVSYHLGKVFVKLGVSSRGQLHAALDVRLADSAR